MENSEYVAFVGRILKAMSKRVGAGDVESLRDLVALRSQLDERIDATVAQLRGEPHYYSWADIGRALDITRQAAQKRYGKTEVPEARKAGGQPAALR